VPQAAKRKRRRLDWWRQPHPGPGGPRGAAPAKSIMPAPNSGRSLLNADSHPRGAHTQWTTTGYTQADTKNV
jgi:hypothetical protein